MSRRPWLVDCAIILGFFAFSAAYFFARVEGAREFCELSSDAGNIASFAAAWDHPELFKSDPQLGDPKNYRWYATVHVPLVRGLVRLTHHYGDAFISLLGLHVFVHLTSYYILGRIWLGSRLWALIFSGMNLVVVPVARSTFWGVYFDPLPRVTFAAIAGFVLAAVLLWRKKPFVWPWIMAAAGLMSFAHPVSTPTFGLMLWMGFCGLLPRSWSALARVGYMVLLGLVFLVAALPFAYLFVRAYPGGKETQSETVQEVREYRLAGSVEPVKNLTFTLKKSVQYLVLPMGLIGAGVLFTLGGDARRSLKMPSLWLLGVLVASAVLPTLLHRLKPHPMAHVFQLQMIRSIRFVYPIMYMIALRAAVEIERMLTDQSWTSARFSRRFVNITSILFVGWIAVMGAKINEVTLLPTRLAYLSQGRIEAHGPSRMWTMIQAIKQHTPPGARILPIDVDALAVRYAAMRPVAFCYKDGRVAADSVEQGRLQWYESDKCYKRLVRDLHRAGVAQEATELARRVEAEYIAIKRGKECADRWPEGTEIVWGNDYFSLVKVRAARDPQAIFEASESLPVTASSERIRLDGR